MTKYEKFLQDSADNKEKVLQILKIILREVPSGSVPPISKFFTEVSYVQSKGALQVISACLRN